MNRKIESKLRSSEDIMSAQSALYMFRLANICIEAKAIALISSTVYAGGTEVGIEGVATVTIPSKDQYAIYPKREEYIMPIIKALRREHPEFSLSIEECERDEREREVLDLLGIKDEEVEEGVDSYLLYTLPAVNEERRDSYTQLTNSLYDATMVELKRERQRFMSAIQRQIIGASEGEISEVNDAIDEIIESNKSCCEGLRDKKLGEIDKAHQLYLSRQTTSEREARSEASYSMRMEEELF